MRQTTACTAGHGSHASTTRMVLIFSLALVVGVGGATPAEELKPARADRYGDPLPPGALMRLGTIRFRHGDSINAAAYSPDGKTLATAGYGGTIRLWDAATGKQVAVFQRENKASITSLAFSPDGKTLAAAGSFARSPTTLKDLPTELVCWDVAKGEARLSIQAGPDAINNRSSFHGLAYSPDGKWLAAGTYDGIGIWDASTGKESKAPRIGYDQDGRCVVTRRQDASVGRNRRRTVRMGRGRGKGAAKTSGTQEQGPRSCLPAGRQAPGRELQRWDRRPVGPRDRRGSEATQGARKGGPVRRFLAGRQDPCLGRGVRGADLAVGSGHGRGAAAASRAKKLELHRESSFLARRQDAGRGMF